MRRGPLYPVRNIPFPRPGFRVFSHRLRFRVNAHVILPSSLPPPSSRRPVRRDAALRREMTTKYARAYPRQ